jgi:hypothetical protein
MLVLVEFTFGVVGQVYRDGMVCAGYTISDRSGRVQGTFAQGGDPMCEHELAILKQALKGKDLRAERGSGERPTLVVEI